MTVETTCPFLRFVEYLQWAELISSIFDYLFFLHFSTPALAYISPFLTVLETAKDRVNKFIWTAKQLEIEFTNFIDGGQLAHNGR